MLHNHDEMPDYMESADYVPSWGDGGETDLDSLDLFEGLEFVDPAHRPF